MKTVITRAFLKKDLAARNGKTAAGMLVVPVLFCLAAFLFVPNKLVALGITAFVVLFAGALYLKYRKTAGNRELSRAYLRCLPLLGKNVVEHTEQDEDGTTTTVEYCLDFGENRVVRTDRKAFTEAREGEPYYVVFSAEDDSPFACYSAAAYEPGPEFTIAG